MAQTGTTKAKFQISLAAVVGSMPSAPKNARLKSIAIKAQTTASTRISVPGQVIPRILHGL